MPRKLNKRVLSQIEKQIAFSESQAQKANLNLKVSPTSKIIIKAVCDTIGKTHFTYVLDQDKDLFKNAYFINKKVEAIERRQKQQKNEEERPYNTFEDSDSEHDQKQERRPYDIFKDPDIDPDYLLQLVAGELDEDDDDLCYA